MIIGNFDFATTAVRFARSHYRQLQHFYIENVRVTALGDLLPLPRGVGAELQWWRDMVASANSKCFSLHDSEINIFSDARLTAGEFVLMTRKLEAPGRQQSQAGTLNC